MMRVQKPNKVIMEVGALSTWPDYDVTIVQTWYNTQHGNVCQNIGLTIDEAEKLVTEIQAAIRQSKEIGTEYMHDQIVEEIKQETYYNVTAFTGSGTLMLDFKKFCDGQRYWIEVQRDDTIFRATVYGLRVYELSCVDDFMKECREFTYIKECS